MTAPYMVMIGDRPVNLAAITRLRIDRDRQGRDRIEVYCCDREAPWTYTGEEAEQLGAAIREAAAVARIEMARTIAEAAAREYAEARA